MSPIPTMRILKSAALAGVACISLFFLPGCGGEEGGKEPARSKHSAVSSAMPKVWPELTKGLLAKLKKDPVCAQHLTGVQDNPRALWQYWKGLVRDLHKADLLPHLMNSGSGIVTFDKIPSGEAGVKLTNQACVFSVFRRELEEAIIRQCELSKEDAEYTRRELFPAVWHAYIHP